MKKYKIMHIIHGLSTGGAETLVKDYMLNFDRRKFDIILLCLNREKDSPYEKILSKNNINVIYVEDYLPFKKSSNIFTKAVNRLARHLIVKRIIAKEKPDVIHSHLTINDYVKFARPKHKVAIFHTIHSDPKKIWQNKKKQKDFKAAKWLTKNRNMTFITLHDTMKSEIEKMFNTKNVMILNNGIDIDKYNIKESQEAIRAKLNIPKNAFVIGHIGRFAAVKNHNHLVDVFTEIYKKNKNAFLLMIGDGPDKQTIQKKLDSNNLKNHYLILSNRSDIPELLKAMDVFVFPSLYEGLGIALIEAQESKLPCFISDVIPRHAIISNLVTKLPLDKSPKQWATAILNYQKPKKIIINDADWDIKKITKQLEQIYLDEIEKKRHGKK